ncbi:MAG: hypothetical protein A2Y40_00110 [Candidatus Margulisbacteria bacterium GWF2_35_9]|nr:MAG: hypothetical protein A2Y40_00110 [Candidatus Margulisbacteria bacterium GWF2_35_9]
MIIPMEKVTLFTIKTQVSSVLHQLRKLGVIHVEQIKTPLSANVGTLEDEITDVKNALSLLKMYPDMKMLSEIDDVTSAVEEVLMLDDERTDLERKKESLLKQQEWYNEWGKVSLNSIKHLEESGFYVKLYQAPRSFMDKNKDNPNLFVVNEGKFDLKLALISRSLEEKLELKEDHLPEMEFKQVESELIRVTHKIDRIESDFKVSVQYVNTFEKYQNQLVKQLEFETIRFGMGEEGLLCYIRGYVPVDQVKKIKEYCDTNDCGYMFEACTEEDNPPVLIKNKRWINIIAPVFKFMGTVPNYNEFDISMWFLLFFGLFFAMLIGDAGYGVLFVVLTFFARKKFKNAPSEPFFLMYAMSGATIFWGAITGTWFGVEKIAQLPVFSSLIIPSISSFGVDNKENIMHLCFFIGAVHLSIAHLLLAFRARKSLRALGQIGWVGIVWGLYFVAHLLVLSQPIPMIGKGALIIGFSLVILFANAQKNMVKGALLSLSNIPLSAISTFSDVVSYVRLFAVGYASVVVAVSFNNMAMGIGFGSVFATLGAVFILVIGHGLNIILGAMALIVHGVRLNMLEFSGHLGMEWSGKEYEPFKE